jgi:hypothetical protein
MYYETSRGLITGVLDDYDLSSTQDTPTGTKGMGTVPFMSLELLSDEAMEGKVEYLYRHDAESFIWVLNWVCLQYEDGQRKGRWLYDWLKDATY